MTLPQEVEMLRTSLGRFTSSTTIDTAAFEIIAPSSVGVYLVEFGMTLHDATASSVGLGVPAAKGVTPTGPLTFLAESGVGTPLTTFARAWGTGPTAPASFFRVATFGAAVGASLVWHFPRGLYIPANSTVVLWNTSAAGRFQLWAVVDQP